jgi:cytochrome c-type biogenesis protein CcmF
VFVTVTLVNEFGRAAMARMRNTGENFLQSIARITAINRRRYGGYIVHFGFVLVIVGITGQAFTTEGWGEANTGDRFSIGKYDFECIALRSMDDPNYTGMAATVAVFQGDKRVAELTPEKRFYHASEQTTSEVRMHHTPREDIYLVFAGMNDDTNKAIFQVWINPLVSWVWMGGWVMGLGTLFTILPNRRERRLKRQSRDVERMLRATEKVPS